MPYPILEIYPNRIKQNAMVLRENCLARGVTPVAVIKGFNGLPELIDVIWDAGYTTIASSRLPHLAAAKQADWPGETMALRIPMRSELSQLVSAADISLNSDRGTLALLDEEAARQNKIHQVVLMRDLGDLREGVFDSQQLYDLAAFVEGCQSLHLLGIGTNLTCYGSVIPDENNLSVLAADATAIEQMLGRKLEVVSGGSTSSVPLLMSNKMPKGINQLRLGECLAVPCDLIDYWNCPLPGLRNDGILLKAEIIELERKPSMPQGTIGRNAFGTECQYHDRGIHCRAVLGLGVLDIGDESKLIPCDEGVKILGASSDHIIADVEDCPLPLAVGDCLTFELHYQAMLFACTGNSVEKRIIY